MFINDSTADIIVRADRSASEHREYAAKTWQEAIARSTILEGQGWHVTWA